MTQLYGGEYDFAASDDDRLIPGRARKLAGAALFLAMVGAMGLWAYRLGTRDAAEVPIIRAMEGPARVQPAEPGGLQAAHQGLEVNQVLAGRPDPAAPQPHARVAAAEPASLAEEDAPQGELVIAAPPVLAADALAAGEDLPMPPADDVEGMEVALIEAPAAVTAVDPASSAAVLDEALAPDPAAQAAAAVAAGPAPMRRPANLVLARAAAPETTPAPAVAPAVARTSEKTPEAAPKPAAKPAPEAAKPAAKPPAREVSSAKSGSRMIQLGAFDSEALARQAWNILAQTNRDLLASKSLYVERTTANARVFYRLRVAGFADQAQTQKMCEALRSRNVDCIPVTAN